VAKTASVLDKYPTYEAVIGIEVHVQLLTQTKIFCSSPNHISKDPNTNLCEICAGYPGVLPVLNKQVIQYAIVAGLATNCTIARRCLFDRKHYFYPDLPKNYQITQNFHPICTAGYVPIRLEDNSIKKIRLVRIHMEEDAGKNIHSTLSNESFVDLNRAGTPLLEIVSYPDLSTAYDAREYLKTLRATVQYLGICSGNMEDGAFRADTNISVRKKGDEKLGTKCELKNINSFKFIGDAIEYEIERQITLLEEGGKVRQETRLWDTRLKETVIMRTKEEAADYRYFEDPDLPIIEINDSWIEQLKTTLPELPQEKFERYCTQLGLTPYEAGILVDDIALASYFEQATKHTSSKQLINWILRDVIGFINDQKITLSEFKITPAILAALVNLIDEGKINNVAAKEVFAIVAQTGKDPLEIVKEKGLEQIGSAEELEQIIKEIIDQNSQQVAQYKAGKEQLFGFFVGQVMQKTRGKGNPKMVQELLKKYLGK
jgi:aspartyl-tRNA(Asn)/glutamyl-tRNA(Gln) amidotransferase subunit B